MPPHPAFSAPYYPTTYQYQPQPQQQPQQPQQAPQQALGLYDEHGGRKRSASDDEDEPQSAGTSAAPTPREENKSKRTKTQRACDPCRRKKIRCDILPDTDPPICQHCKQYSFNCTFFLPITETRFKKKRIEEEHGAGTGGTTSANRPNATPPTPSLDASHAHSHHNHSHPQQPPSQQQQQQQPQSKGEVKIYGPTSLSFLVHSTATIPIRTMESYDTRYHQTWQVGASGEGFIQVLEPSTPNQPAAAPLPKPLEHRVERETLQNLINAYFREVSPTFCVITRDEFVRSPAPPPVLLYSMCVAAACSRRVERGVFEALRATLGTVMRNDDVLSVSSVANVQALLILSMNGDCHSVNVPNATSAAWLRAGAAIRMAQDLGMHRAEAVQTDLELRRRLWSACVIVDSWYAASYGHPLTINVLDCDVRLPRADEAEGHKMEFMGELVKLSILLGRVLKSIYSPTGLLHARDSILETLLADLDLWRHQLPPQFAFNNPATAGTHAGLLHLYYVCVCMMFWRVFMRISYSCPAHLKFSLTVERMTDLVHMSRDVMDWLSMEEHERIFDCCYMVGYAATAAALVQYHAWARRKDPEAVVRLRRLKDTIKRWEASVEPGHMPVRRKTAEIICLLYEATQCVHNVRAPEALRGLEFRKDASRPGGGVFVASKRMIPALSDLPRGTVVPRPNTADGDRDRESVVSATSVSGSEESPFGYGMTQQHLNVNPALAQVDLDSSEHAGVQVLNMLDQPLPSESFAVDSDGILSGIPNGLQYDLGVNEQWNSLLSQFQPTMVGDSPYHLMQPFSEPYMGNPAAGQLHIATHNPIGNGIGFPPMQPFPQQ
ncbi:Pentatricopeptide repeat-containing protein At2g30100, chloroplastic [Rhizoctonia solani]|uniref:Pentatricopeptide repeat-containing protein At2g30100, chloroplastic n=1 Tax=Rhizoctonia solani TaxID=456999 RepID=A0A0K6FPE1_9AGAM|nr:Pentatricopeptide repeat-containing protein At2g30100, chloroplastic [Rhizoctonia solani]